MPARGTDGMGTRTKTRRREAEAAPVRLKTGLGLLEAGQPPDLRCAAALVLGEVGARDAELSAALCEGLRDEEPLLRLQAIRAVGKLRIEQALPDLLERIKD